jgi:hypothetical protein
VIPTLDVYRDSRGRMAKCPLLAQSGPAEMSSIWPLSGAKRTSSKRPAATATGRFSVEVRASKTPAYRGPRPGARPAELLGLFQKRGAGAGSDKGAAATSPTYRRNGDLVGEPCGGLRQPYRDFPTRLFAGVTRGHGYVILRNDGTVAQASSATFPTEAAARAAGGPVLRRRSRAAKLTTLNQERA